jgi:hypothetical protein
MKPRAWDLGRRGDPATPRPRGLEHASQVVGSNPSAPVVETVARPSPSVNPLKRYGPLLIWATLGCISFFFVPTIDPKSTWSGTPWPELLLALSTLGFGCWGFWRHGGRQITGAGIMCFSCAVLVGFAGLDWALNSVGGFQASIFIATACTYFSTIAMYGLFWIHTEGRFPQRRIPASSPRSTRWAVLAGSALVLACTVLSGAGAPGGPILAGGAFVGTLLLATGLVSRPSRRVKFYEIVLVGGGFVLYYKFIFEASGVNGSGRLIVASLGLGICFAFCLNVRGRSVKCLVLVLAFPALLIAGHIRANQTFDGRPPPAQIGPQSPEDSGLASVVTPLQDFGQLIALDQLGQLRTGNGSTFVATSVAEIPRAIWPGKPQGFGAVLTQILEPSLVSVNQSLAALMSGEWFFNFSWLGLVLMVFVVGWLVQLFDSYLAKKLRAEIETRRSIIIRVGLIVAAVGLTDLYWVGTFTFEARLLTRLLFVFALFLIWGRRRPARYTRSL